MSSRTGRIGWTGIWVAVGLSTAIPAEAQVAFNVNSNLDAVDENAGDALCKTAPPEKCTLRAAVMQANALAGFDVFILLPAGTYHLSLDPTGEDGPDSGDLNLTTPSITGTFISIIGDHESTTVIDGDQTDRVFSVEANRLTYFSSLTVRNGRTPNPKNNSGVGILNMGTLELLECTVSDNVNLDAFGGGIYNNGTLTLIRSTIRDNAAGEAGGVVNYGTLTLEDSTVSGNGAVQDGGGILNQSSFTAINSTISLNTAGNNGGGFYNNGVANLYNATIAFNEADSDEDFFGVGAGVYNTVSGSFAVRNALLAGNFLSESPTYDDCAGTVAFYGINYYWEIPNCTPAGELAATRLLGLDSIGPLRYNGGRTRTHALLPGSNAIDGGDVTLGCIGPDSQSLGHDQRGEYRVYGLRCDVGAFESGPIFFDSFESSNTSRWTS